LNVHNVSDFRQIEVHTAEPLVPGLSSLEVETAIAMLGKYKSLSNDEIPAELIQGGGEILMSAIHKHVSSVWNKEELPDQWKESIIVAVRKTNEKSVCNNYHEISLLSTSYKMLSNILLSGLGLYIYEIKGDRQCGFRHRSTTDQGSTMRRYISYS
jgi:hypothetical protein